MITLTLEELDHYLDDSGDPENDFLQLIFDKRFGAEYPCPKCGVKGKIKRTKIKKAFQCSHCGYRMFPLVGTIMQGTKIDAYWWCLFIMELLRDPTKKVGYLYEWTYIGDGVSNEYSITYPTAVKMRRQILRYISGSKFLLAPD